MASIESIRKGRLLLKIERIDNLIERFKGKREAKVRTLDELKKAIPLIDDRIAQLNADKKKIQDRISAIGKNKLSKGGASAASKAP